MFLRKELPFGVAMIAPALKLLVALIFLITINLLTHYLTALFIMLLFIYLLKANFCKRSSGQLQSVSKSDLLNIAKIFCIKCICIQEHEVNMLMFLVVRVNLHQLHQATCLMCYPNQPVCLPTSLYRMLLVTIFIALISCGLFLRMRLITSFFSDVTFFKFFIMHKDMLRVLRVTLLSIVEKSSHTCYAEFYCSLAGEL